MKTQLLLSVLFIAFAYQFVAAQDITEQELVRRSQELMDNVAIGNKEPFTKYYADDVMVFDEKGRSMDKAALLADLEPLPKGYSGSIKVEHAKSRIFADTAILSYDMDESENVLGQELDHARYHETDTWMKRNGQWQIVAAQVLRYYQDPAVGKADTSKFPDYVGTYELVPGTARTVAAADSHLYVQRGSSPKAELLPEAGEVFFRKGVEGRIIFRHDASGKVDALIDRRNNQDILWKKTK